MKAITESSTKLSNFSNILQELDPNKILFTINPYTNLREYEMWESIIKYPDYQISNFGRVKSLGREIKYKFKGKRVVKDRILRPSPNTNGYLIVVLSKSKKSRTRTVHQLIAEAYLSHTPNGHIRVINHTNFIKTDNFHWNLEIVTQRENSNLKHIGSTSKYVGVSFHKINKKWRAYIRVNNKQKFLGYFKKELEAKQAHEEALRLVLKNLI